jgi:8-oxo-dGTP diphosphatase
MKVLLTLLDEEYPFTGFNHIREIVRALVLDEKGQVAVHVVERDDRFGKQTYFETPGGGVDEGETPEEALKRECREELGYEIEVISEIGEVDDAYNLIGRQNHNRYYLAKRMSFVGKHFVSPGDSFIKKTLWVSLDEAIVLYEKMPDHLVSRLVKNRELPIFRLAKKLNR